jgi:hypothetical protein
MTAVANLTNAPLPILDLKPYQGAGIPDKAQLYTRFQATSKTALENFYRQLDQNAGLVSQIIARAQSAIHVKPADNSGNMPQAILARAENDVRGGQIAAALAELKALPEKIQQELKTWTEAAEARLKADQAFQKTDEMLLSMLSQPALR